MKRWTSDGWKDGFGRIEWGLVDMRGSRAGQGQGWTGNVPPRYPTWSVLVLRTVYD